jgi:hypothetical protein
VGEEEDTFELDVVVGTLRTGYPSVQAQDNGSRLPAEGSSEADTCPHGSGSRSRLGAAPRTPCVLAAQAPTPSSGQLRGRHVSPRLGLPFMAQGSSGDAMCPRGLGSPSQLGVALGPPRVPGLCGLHASKQISSDDPTIMISIGAGAPVSSKALRDKGCSASSQGMQQAAH